MFQSDFLCAACDKHWEEHDTFFETEKERKTKKLPFGSLYVIRHSIKFQIIELIESMKIILIRLMLKISCFE